MYWIYIDDIALLLVHSVVCQGGFLRFLEAIHPISLAADSVASFPATLSICLHVNCPNFVMNVHILYFTNATWGHWSILYGHSVQLASVYASFCFPEDQETSFENMPKLIELHCRRVNFNFSQIFWWSMLPRHPTPQQWCKASWKPVIHFSRYATGMLLSYEMFAKGMQLYFNANKMLFALALITPCTWYCWVPLTLTDALLFIAHAHADLLLS